MFHLRYPFATHDSKSCQSRSDSDGINVLYDNNENTTKISIDARKTCLMMNLEQRMNVNMNDKNKQRTRVHVAFIIVVAMQLTKEMFLVTSCLLKCLNVSVF